MPLKSNQSGGSKIAEQEKDELTLTMGNSQKNKRNHVSRGKLERNFQQEVYRKKRDSVKY